jgi:probable phosphoglycerate mutase
MATTKSETLQTVYLVRHGESTENVRSSPIFEQADAQLTDVGRSQAASIATRATRLSFDALISSSMLRARHTAQAISDATGTEITISDLFVERLAPTSFVGSE